MTTKNTVEIRPIESIKYVYISKIIYISICPFDNHNGIHYSYIYIINVDLRCSHENTKKVKNCIRICALFRTRVWKFWKIRKCLGNKLRFIQLGISLNDFFLLSQCNHNAIKCIRFLVCKSVFHKLCIVAWEKEVSIIFEKLTSPVTLR